MKTSRSNLRTGSSYPRIRTSGSRSLSIWFVLLALAVGACSGSQTDDQGTRAGTTASSAGLPGDLEFLGGLAGRVTQTDSVSIGESGGSLSLPDDARLVFSPGSLSESTEVVVVTVDLAFEKYLEDPLVGTVYRISTDRDVLLGAPVVLEVLRPSEEVVVSQRVEGGWRSVLVPAGPTTNVEIDHFSVVTVAVGDRVDLAKVGVPAAQDNSASPSDLLIACMLMVSDLTNGGDDDFDDLDGQLFADQLALSVCTRALVNVLTPGGQRLVTTSCVGEKIGSEVDIGSAIAACIEEGDSSDDDEPDGTPIPAADPSSDSNSDSAPESVAPETELRVWQGEFVDDTAGTANWSTVRTTRIRIEEQADGTLTLTRETDIDHAQDSAVFNPPCPYVQTEDSTIDGTQIAADGGVRFDGDMEVAFIVNVCGDESSAAAVGTYRDIVTGMILGNTLTLDNWYDGRGPAILVATTATG